MNDKPSSVFVTYIATTPEKLWEALTKGEFSRQYFFGRRIESDWHIGSPWRLAMEDGSTDSEGKVIECEPGRKLTLTWRVEWFEECRRLPEAIVTFQLDHLGDVVRLTVSEFHHESVDEKYLEGGRTGWPIILSGLKSLLETGRPLPKFEMPALPTTG